MTLVSYLNVFSVLNSDDITREHRIECVIECEGIILSMTDVTNLEKICHYKVSEVKSKQDKFTCLLKSMLLNTHHDMHEPQNAEVGRTYGKDQCTLHHVTRQPFSESALSQ